MITTTAFALKEIFVHFLPIFIYFALCVSFGIESIEEKGRMPGVATLKSVFNDGPVAKKIIHLFNYVSF